jgi:glycerophosphoryl diester phosphodiesterase
VRFVIPEYRLVRGDLIEACHRAKRKVLVWTVNRPSIMHEMASLGVDGIISDDTKLMVETMRQSLATPL